MTEIELLQDIISMLRYIHFTQLCGLMATISGMVAIYCRLWRRG